VTRIKKYRDRNEKQRAYRLRKKQRGQEQRHGRVVITDLEEAIREPSPEPKIAVDQTSATQKLDVNRDILEELDYSNLSDKALKELYDFAFAQGNEEKIRDIYGLSDEVERRYGTWICSHCGQANSGLDAICHRCNVETRPEQCNPNNTN
jgi:rubrerythrin